MIREKNLAKPLSRVAKEANTESFGSFSVLILKCESIRGGMVHQSLNALVSSVQFSANICIDFSRTCVHFLG